MRPEVQQVKAVIDALMCLIVYGVFGIMSVYIAIDYRKHYNIKLMKGWRATLIFLLWPVWFLAWMIISIIVKFWQFLWSDVK